MAWNMGTVLALIALGITIVGHVVSVTYFLAKGAAYARQTGKALQEFKEGVEKDFARSYKHFDRIYDKLDVLAVSQQEIAELRATVTGLRERLSRIEDGK